MSCVGSSLSTGLLFFFSLFFFFFFSMDVQRPCLFVFFFRRFCESASLSYWVTAITNNAILLLLLLEVFCFWKWKSKVYLDSSLPQQAAVPCITRLHTGCNADNIRIHTMTLHNLTDVFRIPCWEICRYFILVSWFTAL